MRGTANFAATLFLHLLLVCLACVAVVWVFFGAFDVSCAGPRCDYGLKGAAISLMFWGSIATIALSLVICAWRTAVDAESTTWWVVAIAMAVVVVLFIVALALEAAAIDQPFPVF